MTQPISYIGVRDLSFEQRLPKSDLLLFDQVAVAGLDIDLEIIPDPQVRADLEWLRDSGLIFGVNPKDLHPSLDESRPESLMLLLGTLVLQIVRIASLGLGSRDVPHQLVAFRDYGTDRLLNTSLRMVASFLQVRRGVRFTPILRSFGVELGDRDKEIRLLQAQLTAIRSDFDAGLKLLPPGELEQARGYYEGLWELLSKLQVPELSTTEQLQAHSDVIEVVLRSIEIPDETVPWTQLIEFREDPDVRTDLIELRRWMRTLAENQRPQHEVVEEIEHLSAQFRKHMRIHKMKSHPGALRTIITVAAQIAQHLSKSEWGDAAQILFGIRDRKVQLLEAESNAPGHEIAYLFRIQEKLGSKSR